MIDANMRHKTKFSHLVCKEIAYTGNIVMYFSKNFYLIDAINKKLSEFQASGIISHLIDNYIDRRYWSSKKEKSFPSQLSVQHLKGAFELWLILCSFATAALLLELLINAKRPLKIVVE